MLSPSEYTKKSALRSSLMLYYMLLKDGFEIVSENMDILFISTESEFLNY